MFAATAHNTRLRPAGMGRALLVRSPASPIRPQALRVQRLKATSAAAVAEEPAAAKAGWWSSASFWGACGAAAGWGMSGSAIYDSQFQGPEVISLTMTPVMIVYSSLFGWWALAIAPQNFALAACHATNVVAQSYQLYRAVNHKIETGEAAAVQELGVKAGLGATVVAAAVGSSGRLKAAMSGGSLGALASSPAGPFTVSQPRDLPR